MNHLASQMNSSLFVGEVPQAKYIASLVLFVITLLCGYLPVRCLLNQNYVQHVMYAGGGVLMATAFCHLIPEAHNNFRALRNQTGDLHHHHHHNHDHQDHNHQQPALVDASLLATNQTAQTIQTNTTATTFNGTATLQSLLINATDPSGQQENESLWDKLLDNFEGNNSQIPYPELTVCIGFFFMFLVEQLMIKFINNHTHEHPCDTASQVVVLTGSQQQVASSTGSICESNNMNGSSICGAGDTGSNLASSTVNLSSSAAAPGRQHHNHASNGTYGGATTNNNNLTKTMATNKATEFYKFVRGLLIISAFGAHSIFDGVAIGSQETVGTVWTLFFAISCHKLIIAAVVGLELFVATLESHFWTLVHLSIFSIMSPIGIILVVVAQESMNLDAGSKAMVLLQSFATGTLLYIIFIEILQPKKEQILQEKSRLGKSFSLIAGFTIMLIILTFIGHGDGH